MIHQVYVQWDYFTHRQVLYNFTIQSQCGKKILFGNIRIMSIALSSSTLSIRKVNRMEQSRTEKIDGMNFSGKVRLEWRAPGYL